MRAPNFALTSVLSSSYLLAQTYASKITVASPQACDSASESYNIGIVELVDLTMTCDGTKHDYDGDYGEEYTDEYGLNVYDEDNGGNYDGYANEYAYDVDLYNGYGNRRSLRRKLDDSTCYFGQSATITGVIEITNDVDTEMYLKLSVSMFRLSKTLINGINLCEVGELTSNDDGISCPDVGYYTFTQTYDIPSTEYAFLTTGFSGNIRLEIQDDDGEVLGCSKTLLKSVRTDDDPPLSGVEIALLVIGLIILSCACTCVACRTHDRERFDNYRRKLPLVYPRRNNAHDYGMYA